MIELNNQFTIMKRRIDSEVVRRFFSDTLIETADRLPIEIIPKDRIPSRCCIYKERAMVRYRVLTLLGVDLDHEDDEFKPLGEYQSRAAVMDVLRTSTGSVMPAGDVSLVLAWPTVRAMP